jgi:hypothetical protein
LIDAAVEHGRPLEVPPVRGVYYHAFTDAAGGVGADAYTVSIAHRKGEHVIVDVVRGTTGKFDPQEVTKQYAALLKEYGSARSRATATPPNGSAPLGSNVA